MIEILPGRLYLHFVSKVSPKDNNECHYFTTDNNLEFHYEKFYEDFGPLNVAVLYKFCTLLQQKMTLVSLSKKRLIYYVASRDEEKRSNAAYLIGSFSILYLRMTCEDVCKLFCKSEQRPFHPFRDAAPGDSTYGLRLFDVFRAIEKASSLNWIDFDNFDLDEYEYFEKVENGDLNWIIPGKILAFCGPHLKTTDEDGYPRHSPETYFDYFKKHNVTHIVRLNRKVYESSRFTEAGFRHDDLFFVDGSTPSNAIVLKFIKLIEDASGAVAVHCKAGLGRTGTLIACYMMKHYGFTAPECMAWIRICRPGSIIGPQQQFLIHVQNWCRSLPGSNYRTQSPDNNSRLAKSNHAFASDFLSQAVDRVRVTENSTPCTVVGQYLLETSCVQSQTPPARKAPSSFYRSKTVRPYHQGEHLMKIKGSRKSQSCRTLKSKFKSDNTVGVPSQISPKQMSEPTPETSRRRIPSKSSKTTLVKFTGSAPKQSPSSSPTSKAISVSDRPTSRKLSDRNNNKHKSTEKWDESMVGESKKDKTESGSTVKTCKKVSSDSAEKSTSREIIALLQGETWKAHSCKEHQSLKSTSPTPFSFNKSRPGRYVKYSLRRLSIKLRANTDDKERNVASGICKTAAQEKHSNETANSRQSKGLKSK